MIWTHDNERRARDHATSAQNDSTMGRPGFIDTIRGQDYKEISIMDWCSTHNLSSDMTSFRML